MDSDLRGISPRGVNLVMRVFKKAFHASPAIGADAPETAAVAPPTVAESAGDALARQIQAAAAECDEIFNDPIIAE